MMGWSVGQTLEAITKPPITQEQLNAYASASGDKNPIHLAPEFAQRAGFPTVIAHGMISMAFLADLVGQNFPEEKYRLVRFNARFRKVVVPGEVLRCEGKVQALTPEGRWVLALSAVSSSGEVVTDAEAELEHRS